MAFEDSPQSASRFLSEGFRPELEFREAGSEYVPPRRDVTTFEVAPTPTLTTTAPPTISTDTTASLATRAAPPNLEYVFDDPADGEPGRDRMLVHGLWELLLALALAGAGYLLYRAQPSAFGGEGVRQLLLSTTVLGLIATASALALRSGVPNLAVGGVAVMASADLGMHAGDGLRHTIVVLLGICAGIGLLLGLVIVVLHVPAWAASLAAALGLVAWLAVQQNSPGHGPSYDAGPHAYYWFAAFCAVSLAGSAVGLVPSLRRLVGRFRPVADPAHRRGVIAAVIALCATVVSTILAGAGGVLAAFVAGQPQPTDGLELTALALGAALLGGTSAFGRRGGIFGTIFAAGLIAVAMSYAVATERHWPTATFAAVAIAVGMAVTRLVERFGRPASGRRSDEDDDWTPKVHALTPSGRSWQPPPTPAGGMWASDDAWGSIEPR